MTDQKHDGPFGDPSIVGENGHPRWAPDDPFHPENVVARNAARVDTDWLAGEDRAERIPLKELPADDGSFDWTLTDEQYEQLKRIDLAHDAMRRAIREAFRALSDASDLPAPYRRAVLEKLSASRTLVDEADNVPVIDLR